VRRSLRVGGLGAVVGALALSCQSIIGADFGAQHLAVCDPKTPPGPPDGGGKMAGPLGLTVVIYSIDWGDNDDAAHKPRSYSIGYDLDGRCTSLFDSPACEPASWTGKTLVDGPNGIDNAIGLMLHDQTDAFGVQQFTSTFFNMNIQNGSQAPPAMFRLTGYNGLSYDEQVTVEWFVPAAATDDAGAPDFGANPVFAVAPGTAEAAGAGGGLVSHFIDRDAYVSGYRLVAHFTNAPIGISNVPIKTADSVFTAHLQTTEQQLQLLDGLVAGHVLIAELFNDTALLSTTTGAGEAVTVCRNTPIVYANVKRWLCGHTDTAVRIGAGQPCNALSFGAAFVARPAQVGSLAAPTPPKTLCMQGENPAGDTCDTAPK
jgi:hypothetical protein